MNLIEGNEGYAIPEEFWTSYNVCQILMEQLTEVLTSEAYEDMRKTTIQFGGTPMPELDTEAMFEWLIANGRHDTITTTLTKHITMSVLGDFVQFMMESLDATKNGRLSVAYALCRKPLLDELLILEQILVDNDDFIHRYYIQGSTDLYDPSNRKLEKVKIDIIANAISRLPLKAMFDAKFIYELRYDKSVKYGVNWISNHALHIVTTDPNYRTSNRNFNFVFSTEDDIHGYLQHYYAVMPILLFYVNSIIDEIVFPYLPNSNEWRQAKSSKRIILFMLHIAGKDKVDDYVNMFSDALKHTCKMCQHEIQFELADFTLFFSQDVLLCSKCITDQFADKDFAAKFNALDTLITQD